LLRSSRSFVIGQPLWCRGLARKTPKITEVLPLLYLHGLSDQSRFLTDEEPVRRPGQQV
jgi:hypothetical protein